MFTLDDFKPISIEDKPAFSEHAKKYPPFHSEDMFSTMVAWQHFVEYCFKIVDDNLIIFGQRGEVAHIRPPIGPRNTDILDSVVQIARKFDSDRPIVTVKDSDKEWISQKYPGIKFEYNRGYFDYVYLASDLAELPGKPYLKIRNSINKFKRRYQYEVEPICIQNIDEINEFLGRWCLWRDCESDVMLENEKTAILYSTEHCFDLDLCGISLRIGGNIEAISVYEEMNPETAIIHFEKAMPDYTGIYQTVNMETAKILAEDYKFINRESDLGIEGLRTAKERYHPHHMEKVSYVKKEYLAV